MGEGRPIWITAVLGVVRVCLYGYEAITWIVWKLTVNPRQRRAISNRIKAVPTSDEPGAPWRDVDYPELTTTLFPECQTLDELFRRTVSLHGPQPCLGTREIFSEEDEVQPNGKVFKKLVLGNYKWESFDQVQDRACNFGSGLQALGQQAKAKIVIFSETRAEWMVAAQGCFIYNFPVVTLYSTLGDDAVKYAVNQTDVSHIITSFELLPKLKSIVKDMPTVKHLIYFTNQLGKTDESGFPEGVTVNSMAAVEQLGVTKLEVKPVKPCKDDIALIMYTSGSTGVPKGVIMAHGNLMAGMSGQCTRILDLGADDCYIGYLPLAHVLELTAEMSCIAHGTPIGYSSPNTLSDRSTKIKRGSKGDATVLKPTLMAAVPVILDRMYKIVHENVAAGGDLMEAVFELAYTYKARRLERGYNTPVFNKTIFKKVREILGGRIRMMLVGGAPLSAETQRFMNICFCCPVAQGYGLTETCGAGTICEASDLSTGRVGAPLSCNYVKLSNWEEGGYSNTDKPNPRGEILLGGGNVTLGYYKNEAAADFKVVDGTRWFCTGDIGEICSDGSMRIIDRKKDLVKLQAGEYVSLGKVETAMSRCPLVENICVYADSRQHYAVSLVVPARKELIKLGESLGKNGIDYQLLCKDKDIEKEVMKMMAAYGKKGKLERFEIPQRVNLCAEAWTPEMGLLTDAFKLKRRNITDHYKQELLQMYS